MEVDLDQKRSEAQREPNSVVIGGKQFELPEECPIDLADMLNEGRPGAALRELFGDDYDEAKTAAGGQLSLQDLARIVNAVYALSVPESPASSASSDSDGDSSRQTSSGTTVSTLAKRSGRQTAGGGAVSDGS